ncbi:transketolase [Lactococcus lactis]|uniref:Transketolase, N-terminal subunit n=1 Tax=Lactococcus lactis subsp. lactis A12 TaxID=1137134 RepID=S6F4N6_LACLL|nr:transketolase [Lactococcus lactis]CDG03774.1 Putative transketolase, N-terminal subunit [Lactococcus lactis subsp. lactis A12]SBW29573.1 Putative transketolase, N-terminal subunit [Lactococcus lactis subsp. lactis]
MEIIELQKKAIKIRKEVLKMIDRSRTGHTGSDLSCADILVALYYGVMNIDPQNPEMEGRDQYVQSKGHAVETLWAILADKGFFPKKELETFSQFGTRLIGHPNNKVEGIEMNTGSLGHGLPVSVGIALAGKLDHKDYHTYTLMGDGELAEGSVWEGAMSAANYKLDNLTAIIDRNKLQITGPSESVMAVENLKAKWEAFGWEVHEVPGNDIAALVKALKAPNQPHKPKMIIALTTKGKGVSYMENQAVWHHKVPSPEEYSQAMKELDRQLEELENA